MATDATKVMIGAGTVSIGAYTSAGGAGSLTDVGHTKEPVTLTPAFENYDAKSERSMGIVKTKPIGADYTIKVSAMETIPERLRIALRQPAAGLTGTSPNETLLVGDPQEIYHQISIVGPGPGTTGVRTLTFWKCQVMELGEIPFAKAGEQVYNMTFRVLRDDSVATLDKYFKQIDA